MANSRPLIVGIGGTTRPGSSSEKALRHALALAAADGADVELFDGASINLPMYAPESAERSEGAQRMVAALRRANGVILSTPCYHGSVSGLVERFDEDGVGLQDHTTRQMLVMVRQVMEFARLRSLLAKPSPPDAQAIGSTSKARRAGVKLGPPPKKGKTRTKRSSR